MASRQPGQPSQAPRRADALRNERAIVETAMRVLAERPRASMAEIASACGLGRATLYRHFATRGELVGAIRAQAVEAGARALDEARLDEGSAVDALRRAIAALVGVGDRYRLLAREAAIHPGVMPRQPAVAGRLVELVRRGQQRGELRDDLPPSWIVPALAGLLVLAVGEMADERAGPREAARRVAATLLDGLARSPGESEARPTGGSDGAGHN